MTRQSENSSTRHCSGRPGRRGFTLIELLVSLSIASVLLIVNAIWIHQTLRYSKVQALRKANHQSMTRLAWQFRDDVRDSNSVNAIDAVKTGTGSKLQLNFDDDAKVTYTLKANFVLIEWFSKGDDTASRFESFDLPPNAIANWDVAELPKWVALEVRRGDEMLPSKKLDLESDSAGDSAGDERAMDLYVRVSPKRWPQVGSQIDPPTSKRKGKTAPSVEKPDAANELEDSK